MIATNSEQKRERRFGDEIESSVGENGEERKRKRKKGKREGFVYGSFNIDDEEEGEVGDDEDDDA